MKYKFPSLRYQKHFLIGLSVIFILGFMFGLLTAKCPVFVPQPIEDYEDCHAPFCEAMKEGYAIRSSNDFVLIKISKLSKTIFTNNEKAQLNAISYYGIGPIRSTFIHADGLGALLKCDLHTGRFWSTLFPHGWLEMLSMLLMFSLFYSFILNLVLILFKKTDKIKVLLKKVIYQIVIILVIDAIAAILESIAILI